MSRFEMVLARLLTLVILGSMGYVIYRLVNA